MDKFDRDMLEMARIDAEFQYKNPNDYFSLEELEEIREVIAHATHTNPDVFHVIRQKIAKTIKESQKPEGEPREHDITLMLFDSLYSTNLWLTIHELHVLDQHLAKVAYDYMIEPSISVPMYTKWQKIRAKIHNEIIKELSKT